MHMHTFVCVWVRVGVFGQMHFYICIHGCNYCQSNKTAHVIWFETHDTPKVKKERDMILLLTL